jgi:hypothetical protein
LVSKWVKLVFFNVTKIAYYYVIAVYGNLYSQLSSLIWRDLGPFIALGALLVTLDKVPSPSAPIFFVGTVWEGGKGGKYF